MLQTQLPLACMAAGTQLQLLTACGWLFSRWDIQRIREQRILQRLQLRMYKRKGIQESEPEVTSFFPEPDDGECLVVQAGLSALCSSVTPFLSPSGKLADHPLPACRCLWPPLTQTDPTVSTKGHWRWGIADWDGDGAVGC